MIEHRMAQSLCPYCGYKMDCASGVDHNKHPTPRSLSICIMCGGFLKFNDQLSLEKLEDDEFQELPASVQRKLNLVRETVAKVHENKRKELQ